MHKVLILTAIQVEYQSISSFLGSIKETTLNDGSIYEQGIFKMDNSNCEVTIVQTGVGNIKAAIQTERAVKWIDPDLVLFVGVAGGVKDVELGDVVIGEKIYSYEFGKAGIEFFSRPNIGLSSYSVVQRAIVEARNSDWKKNNRNDYIDVQNAKVFVGSISAGEKVVSSTKSETYKFIKKHYNDTLAIEMEGKGYIEAVYSNNIDACIIRGISDLIDNKSKSDKKGYQKLLQIMQAHLPFI